MKTITAIVIGYGLRGRDYTRYAIDHPEKLKIVALADTNAVRLADGATRFGLQPSQLYQSADDILAMPKLADFALIATQDRQHVEMAQKALEKGYDLLVEKPISPSLQECLALRDTASRLKRSVTVCHVMRYTHFFQTIKEAITSGIIGDVQCIQALENVGYFHFAHSFCRGNWRKEAETSPMILAKCCHDLDLILWLMDKNCTYVSSFGSLNHFKQSKAPTGAAKRCLDGCQAKETCPYDAEKIYVTNHPTGIKANAWRWPCTAICEHPTVDTVYDALQTGPYGRCVFHCDNDVVDHQIVNLCFEDGATATLTMSAFTNSDERDIKIMGTMGDIIGSISTNRITVQPFGKAPIEYDMNEFGESDGHSGGDMRLMESLVQHVQEGTSTLTDIEKSVQSHVVALASEYSRKNNGCSVHLETFEKEGFAK